jgi:hypothetical protein
MIQNIYRNLLPLAAAAEPDNVETEQMQKLVEFKEREKRLETGPVNAVFRENRLNYTVYSWLWPRYAPVRCVHPPRFRRY